jgi:hypothetical protein
MKTGERHVFIAGGPVSVLTFDTLQQRREGQGKRLKAGGPYREPEIGKAKVGPRTTDHSTTGPQDHGTTGPLTTDCSPRTSPITENFRLSVTFSGKSL